MAQKLKTLIIVICSVLVVGALAAPAKTFAVCTADDECPQQSAAASTPSSDSSSTSTAPSSSIGNGCKSDDSTTSQGANACLTNDPIVKDLNVIVNVLSGLVGVVVTAVIVLGGVQYATAGGSSEAVSKAKARITNGLLALLAFILTFAFLQWIIPGGVFS